MKKVIVILEDDDDILELYTLIFNEEGYNVYGFANVAAFGQHVVIPDLYILDVMLPDGNGLDVCERLKGNPHYAKVPIIMMSAHMQKNVMMEKCLADEYIEKPFDMDFLLNRVARLIN
jgi:DNA-binding response OmpR family regulator